MISGGENRVHLKDFHNDFVDLDEDDEGDEDVDDDEDDDEEDTLNHLW